MSQLDGIYVYSYGIGVNMCGIIPFLPCKILKLQWPHSNHAIDDG